MILGGSYVVNREAYKKTHIWVAMTGRIDIELEFLMTLQWLLDRTSEGLVEGIVLSTWVGELDRYPSLRKTVQSTGIIIKELSIPKHSTKEVGWGSREIQEYQLQACLQSIPSDSLVIKCRTDLSIKWLINHKTQIFSDEFILSKSDYKGSTLRHRLMINTEKFSVVPPFRFLDQNYIGHKLDLMNIIDLSNTELTHFDYSPDDRIFKIHQEFPIIREVIQHISFSLFFKCHNHTNFELPNILNKFYALYFYILYTQYYPNTVESDNAKHIETVDELFLDNNSAFVQSTVSMFDVKRIVEGSLKLTPCYSKLLNEMAKIKDITYAHNMKFETEEWLELKKWVKDNLNVDPASVVFHKEEINRISPKYDITYSLFPDRESIDLVYQSISTGSSIVDIPDKKTEIQYYLCKMRTWEFSYIPRFVKLISDDISLFDSNYDNTFERMCIMSRDLTSLVYYCQITNNHNINSVCSILNIPYCDDIEMIFRYLSEYPDKFIKMPTGVREIDSGRWGFYKLYLSYDLFNISHETKSKIKSVVETDLYKSIKSSAEACYEMGKHMLTNGYKCLPGDPVSFFKESVTLDESYFKRCYDTMKNSCCISNDVVFNFLELGRSLKYTSAYALTSKEILADSNVENLKKAAEYMRVASNSGSIEYTLELCDILSQIASDESYAEMNALLQPLVNNHNPKAIGKMARAYRDGKGVGVDLNKAAIMFYEAFTKGESWFRVEYFETLWKINTNESLKQMISFGEERIKLNDSEIIARMARAYWHGVGVSQDLKKAAELMFKTTSGYPLWSKWEYFDILWEYKDPKYDEIAFEYAMPFANKGLPQMQGRIGRAFRWGRGVNKNLEEAKSWMRKASASDIPWISNELFDMLYESQDHIENEEAIKVISRFVDQGNGGSIGRMGRAYLHGKGVPQDIDKAIELLEKASILGVTWAKEELDYNIKTKKKKSTIKVSRT